MTETPITPAYCQMMARYNAWQNYSLYREAKGLSAEARDLDRGAFWGSITRTLSHLYWGDMIWLSRFDAGEAPEGPGKGSPDAYSWERLWTLRPQLDARIAAWTWSLDQSDLDGDLTWYSGAAQKEMSLPKALCVMQFFNHQTHHRGQVHAMLTAAGAKPDDTDVPMMPDEVPEWR